MRYATVYSRLVHAEQRARVAEENCPHWDYESDGDPCAHPCCAELADALAERKAARNAWRKFNDHARL